MWFYFSYFVENLFHFVWCCSVFNLTRREGSQYLQKHNTKSAAAVRVSRTVRNCSMEDIHICTCMYSCRRKGQDDVVWSRFNSHYSPHLAVYSAKNVLRLVVCLFAHSPHSRSLQLQSPLCTRVLEEWKSKIYNNNLIEYAKRYIYYHIMTAWKYPAR